VGTFKDVDKNMFAFRKYPNEKELPIPGVRTIA
jgi:hypothetical protein